jgi:hypothetical protein
LAGPPKPAANYVSLKCANQSPGLAIKAEPSSMIAEWPKEETYGIRFLILLDELPRDAVDGDDTIRVDSMPQAKAVEDQRNARRAGRSWKDTNAHSRLTTLISIRPPRTVISCT